MLYKAFKLFCEELWNKFQRGSLFHLEQFLQTQPLLETVCLNWNEGQTRVAAAKEKIRTKKVNDVARIWAPN